MKYSNIMRFSSYFFLCLNMLICSPSFSLENKSNNIVITNLEESISTAGEDIEKTKKILMDATNHLNELNITKQNKKEYLSGGINGRLKQIESLEYDLNSYMLDDEIEQYRLTSYYRDDGRWNLAHYHSGVQTKRTQVIANHNSQITSLNNEVKSITDNPFDFNNLNIQIKTQELIILELEEQISNEKYEYLKLNIELSLENENILSIPGLYVKNIEDVRYALKRQKQKIPLNKNAIDNNEKVISAQNILLAENSLDINSKENEISTLKESRAPLLVYLKYLQRGYDGLVYERTDHTNLRNQGFYHVEYEVGILDSIFMDMTNDSEKITKNKEAIEEINNEINLSEATLKNLVDVKIEILKTIDDEKASIEKIKLNIVKLEWEVSKFTDIIEDYINNL